tara:strand:+ start:966 stop:1166 length:201 start_codon:yes stop_codon:yes gene_type:complete
MACGEDRFQSTGGEHEEPTPKHAMRHGADEGAAVWNSVFFNIFAKGLYCFAFQAAAPARVGLTAAG